MIALSVVIPVKDEAESLKTLYKELKQVLHALSLTYEILFIDDGSTDNTHKILASLENKDLSVHVITFRANFGKSVALSDGFEAAKGDVIVTLDADLQDDPSQLPRFLKKLDEGFDLVVGWRKKRFDTPTKLFSSRLFNFIAGFITRIPLHDINCGMKVMKLDAAKDLHLYGELHRFIPILVAKNKYKVTEVIVQHRRRQFGTSKYGTLGLSRGWKGAIDLLTSIFISDYSTKPAHFFGKIGIPLFVAGFIMDLYVTIIKITTGTTQGKIPLLLLGILCMTLGLQLLSTGLIAEMITFYFDQKGKDSHLRANK
jgi:glycosyltransferase involved in cell wall biosynthesis